MEPSKCVRILGLTQEMLAGVHPSALKIVAEFTDRLCREDSLKDFSVDQMGKNLLAKDWQRYELARKGLTDWLCTCVSPKTPDPWSLTEPLPFLREIESLVREAQGNKRLLDAFETLHIPDKREVEVYLDTIEIGLYNEAVRDYVHHYLDCGEIRRLNPATLMYRSWAREIQQRRAKRKQREEAQEQLPQVTARFNAVLQQFTNGLSPQPKQSETILHKLITDPRLPYCFLYQAPRDKEHQYTSLIRDLAGQQIPEELREYIAMDIDTSFYGLLYGEYILNVVPSLDFYFDIVVVAAINFRLIPGTKSINGFTFPFPWLQKPGYRCLLRAPRALGYGHYCFTGGQMGNLGRAHWQTMPLTLVNALMEGHTDASGCTLEKYGGDTSFYRVGQWPGDVVVPDRFAYYLKQLGSLEALASKKILAPKVVTIADGVLKQHCGPDKNAGKPTGTVPVNQVFQTVVTTLTNQMGYAKPAAEKAVKQALATGSSTDFSNVVKTAVNYLQSQEQKPGSPDTKGEE